MAEYYGQCFGKKWPGTQPLATDHHGEDGYKECRRCGVIKRVAMFPFDPTSGDGRNSVCLKCHEELFDGSRGRVI